MPWVPYPFPEKPPLFADAKERVGFRNALSGSGCRKSVENQNAPAQAVAETVENAQPIQSRHVASCPMNAG